MKSMNNTCLEVLPSLLDKTKNQSIRKAWKGELNPLADPEIMMDTDTYGGSGKGRKGWDCIKDKPKYQVGDKVNLFWNKESKDTHFCPLCGKGINSKKCMEEYPIDWYDFNKLLGTVEITEVFEIEMRKEIKLNHNHYTLSLNPPTDTIHLLEFQEDKVGETLAKRDGFSSTEQMFKYFNKEFDLSQSRKFHVTRWKWI